MEAHPEATPSQAKDALIRFQQLIRTALDNNPGVPVNQMTVPDLCLYMNYLIRCALAPSGWKGETVIWHPERRLASARRPGKFFLKSMPDGQRIHDYWLHGKRHQYLDVFNSSSLIFPYQALASNRFHKILSDFRLDEHSWGECRILSYDQSTYEGYKFLNFLKNQGASYIDFAASVITKYDDTSHEYVPIRVQDSEEFAESKGVLQNVTFNLNSIPDLDLLIVKGLSGWVISERLALHLKESGITGLFGFPLTPTARVDAYGFYRYNENFFA